MDNQISLNRGLISTLCKEIFADLSEIKNLFPKTPDRLDTEVVERLSKLSRIASVSRLRGLSRIFDVLSKSAEQFVSTSPDTAKWDIFMRCFRSLQNHLQEVVYEHKNTPITMARPLYNLMQASGMDVSPALAGELFMPFIPFDFSGKARPTQISKEDFSIAVIEHRQHYSNALAQLVRQNDMGVLPAMRQALVTLEPKNPHPGFRLFFDASIAFFDRLIKTQQLDNLSKWLVGRIEPELSRLEEQKDFPADNILSAILYVVAQAEPTSGARIRKLQETYQLSQYMADPNGVDPAVMEKFLNVLIKAREMWTQAVSSGSLNEFKRLVHEMHQKASYLKNAGFSLIVEQMHQLTDYELSNPGKINKNALSLEGASALLIMEQQVREGSHMDLARSTANKLMVLMGKEVEQVEGEIESVVGSRQKYSVQYRLAEELLVDLGGIEQNLLDFLSGNLEVKEDMMSSLKNVENILRVLPQPDPANFVGSFSLIVKIPDTKEERERLANGFAHLTSMVELLKNSESASVDAAKKGMLILHPKEEEIVVVQDEVIGNVDVPNDQDLLEIFLEETVEIMGNLQLDVPALAKNPQDKELMTRIRRAYHTLKGSGRMVGLKHFGESAWLVEDTLNRWMKKSLPANDDLVGMLELSMRCSSSWLDQLRLSEAKAMVDYSEIEAWTNALNRGEGKPSSTSATQAAPVAESVSNETDFKLDILPELSLPTEFETPQPTLSPNFPPALETPAPSLAPVFKPEVIETPVHAEPVEIAQPEVVVHEEPMPEVLEVALPVQEHDPMVEEILRVVEESPAAEVQEPVVESVVDSTLAFEPVYVEPVVEITPEPMVVEEAPLTLEMAPEPVVEQAPLEFESAPAVEPTPEPVVEVVPPVVESVTQYVPEVIPAASERIPEPEAPAAPEVPEIRKAPDIPEAWGRPPAPPPTRDGEKGFVARLVDTIMSWFKRK